MTPRFPPHAYFAHRSGRQEQQVTGEPAICDILAGPRLLFDLEPTEHQLIDSWSIVIGPSPNPGSATRGALGNRRPVSFDCPPLGDKPPGPLGQDDWQQLGEVLPSASRPLYDLSRSTERGRHIPVAATSESETVTCIRGKHRSQSCTLGKGCGASGKGQGHAQDGE
jgi:hypothetical protein